MRLFFAAIVVPLLFFGAVEIGLRLAKANTDAVVNRNSKIVTPVWIADDINFFGAGGIYQDIIKNKLPAHSANWLFYFEEAPYVGFRMKPDLDDRLLITVNAREIQKRHKISVRTNSEGFRSRELRKKKAAGIFRIVFLGDSSTFGWAVNQEERFSDLLEKRLNESPGGIRCETINLALPGYTSLHGLQAFRRIALSYAPDLVICSFGANDGKPISKPGKELLARGNKLQGLHFFLLNFKTYKLLRKWSLQLSNPVDRIDPAKAEEKVSVATIDEFRENLEAIVQLADRNNTKVAFLPLCCPIDYFQSMAEEARSRNLPFIDGTDILMKGVSAVRSGERYPEMVESLRRLYGDDTLAKAPMLYTTSDTCHPNAIGHRLLADALYEKLFASASR